MKNNTLTVLLYLNLLLTIANLISLVICLLGK